MVDELRELGVELMVSIWPTVNPDSVNYAEMDRRGLLVGSARALPLHLPFWDKVNKGPAFVRYYDATNPEARQYIWAKVTDGYGRYGIRTFWLDACEPEMRPEDPEGALYYLGPGMAVQNVYPREHARGFAEGLRASGEDDVLLLCRSAWAGSQRYGAAVWSGDTDSTFEALAAQIPAGLNIAISGIPWWTTDIGGFKGGDPSSPYFRELVVRWFQFGVFCPLFRLHGVREPGPLVGSEQTGAPNEVWSFGDEAYGIIREQLAIRERLRPYVMDQMATASRHRRAAHACLVLGVPQRDAGVGGTRRVHVRSRHTGGSRHRARRTGTGRLPSRGGVMAGRLDRGPCQGQRLDHGRSASGTHTRVPAAGRSLEHPVQRRKKPRMRDPDIDALATEGPTWLGPT